ncbi:MAG TPA: hypothetical protein VFE89_02010 [Beijerinckiaceae bacterium]|jgi:hypothetical protein|nr:hypothetical protein [Beijerinckiaceae bacterium]
MTWLRRRDQRHRRNPENDTRLRIDRAQLRYERRHVCNDVLDIQVDEFVPPFVKRAAEHARAQRKDRAVPRETQHSVRPSVKTSTSRFSNISRT